MSNPHPLPEYQFKPGESGNPAGRPAGTKNFTTLVREALKKIAESEDNVDGKTYEEILAESVGPRALKDERIFKLMWEHLDGKPTQKVDLTAELGEQSRESIAELTQFFRSIAKQ